MRDFLDEASALPRDRDRLAAEFVRRLDTGPAVGDGETLFEGLARVLIEVALVEPGDDERALRRTIRECLTEMVTTLRAHYAQALLRVEIEGRKVREFADEAGISHTNGGVRLKRARFALKARVRAALTRCGEHASHVCECDPF